MTHLVASRLRRTFKMMWRPQPVAPVLRLDGPEVCDLFGSTRGLTRIPAQMRRVGLCAEGRSALLSFCESR